MNLEFSFFVRSERTVKWDGSLYTYMPDPASPRRLEAIDKTVQILEALRELDGAGVTELATRLNLPKTTVHAHLSSLEQNQLVVNEGDHYRLGLRFISFGEHIKNSREIYDIVRVEVDRLSEEVGELTNFLVEEHGLGVYLYKSRAKRGVQTKASVGVRRPLHCIGVGKAILAYLPKERIEEIIDTHGLEPQTENTITDRAELYEELETIKDRGYAIDDEEIQPGLRCVAAPIRDGNGGVLGGISVAGPAGRMKGEKFNEEIPEMVMSTANVLEVNVRNMD